jgi:hypothetical protein
MVPYLHDPELWLGTFQQREQEWERRAALWRALAVGAPDTPGAKDRVLTSAGDALIAFGSWLKARSSLATSAIGMDLRVYQ